MIDFITPNVKWIDFIASETVQFYLQSMDVKKMTICNYLKYVYKMYGKETWNIEFDDPHPNEIGLG